MKDCLECKDYRDCEGHNYIIKTEAGEEYVSWYNYEEIRFCPYQIYFIIENEALLGTGRWPDSPESSSSIEPSIKTGYRSEAYYTKPEIILGEFNKRLSRTGTHGKLLRAEISAGLELSQESKDALMYVKGWRRKRMSFSAWKKQGRYRNDYQTVIIPS